MHPPPEPPSQPRVAASAPRFLVSLRKSLVPPRRKHTDLPRAAMYSTPEERRTYPTSRAGPSRYLDARPTIEQIAMGLHVSRTPHLRPVPNQRLSLPSLPPRAHGSSPLSSDNIPDTSTSSSHHRARHTLPPPPSRSSMKKTSPPCPAHAHPQQRFSPPGSPSVPMSAALSTANPPRPLSSLRARVSKFIPGYRLSLPSSLGRASSVTSSASDSTRPATPRKAVRFSTSVLAIDERSS